MFIAIKTDDGRIKGKISFYCKVLHVSRQAFNKYLKTKDAPWKYQALADAMIDICSEDECNDTYGRIRMYQALQLKHPEDVHIPGERTVYRVMEELGLNHKPKRKPNGITKADKEARKSDDLIKRDFSAQKPLEKCITDMTEIKASDGKLYVSAIFDCYDLAVLGLAMDTNMKATLCEQTLDNAYKAYPMLRGAVLHSDRGTQYTSELYRKAINKYGILQSMNSAGGRCHDNASADRGLCVFCLLCGILTAFAQLFHLGWTAVDSVFDLATSLVADDRIAALFCSEVTAVAIYFIFISGQ